MSKLELPPDHRYVKGRVCTVCKEYKTQEHYTKARDSRSIGGVSMRSICKPCDEPRKRKADLKRFYGITPEQYEELNTKQCGKCAICGSTESNNSRVSKRLFVDHCHTTGAIRGLLCSNCNHALGQFKDSTTLLANAITYLNSSNDIKEN